jgi:hypothetical protein
MSEMNPSSVPPWFGLSLSIGAASVDEKPMENSKRAFLGSYSCGKHQLTSSVPVSPTIWCVLPDNGFEKNKKVPDSVANYDLLHQGWLRAVCFPPLRIITVAE